MIDRRQAMIGLAAGLALPRASFASAPTDRRLVLVLLRGGLDGLAAVPPWRDPAYAAARRDLAFDPPGAAEGIRDLDGFFGLHPSLPWLHERYLSQELLVLHAVATPYRDRSHFDGQDVLENGAAKPHLAADGWLNRALGALQAGPRMGLAIGQQVPLVLRGAAPVGSWAPSRLPGASEDFLTKVSAMWAHDPTLARALADAMRSQSMSDEILAGKDMQRGVPRQAQAMTQVAEAAGMLLAAPEGARIAVLEAGGWDTHAQQGLTIGRLANALAGLDQGLSALARGLGPAWSKTAILVVSEFGRTVPPNGSGGTDHGTAGMALLLGGAVQGGRVLADWPGLDGAQLHEGRDLRPTLDLRRVAKGLLQAQFGLEKTALDRTVFPDSAAAAPLTGLLRG